MKKEIDIKIENPTVDIIRQFNQYWKMGKIEDSEENKKLFKEKKIDLSEIKTGEDILDSLFDELKNNDFVTTYKAVLMLDSIYHTRLKNPYIVAKKINNLIDEYDLINSIEKTEKDNITKASNVVHKITQKSEDYNEEYIYSFATKFCNRINPVAFPIFDSYVASLLCYYLKNEKFYKKDLGKYSEFINLYNVFRKKYELIEKNENGEKVYLDYKTVDRFMWTYGKIVGQKLYVLYIEPN